tara:strand:+ start:599 stop:766 length:168 start_codon:yes stop_codon:yes gene_type:complete
MFFKSTKWEDEIHFTLANLNTPHNIEPKVYAYFDTHVGWLNFDDGLKRLNDPQKN